MFRSGTHHVQLYLNDEEGKPKKTIDFSKQTWQQLCKVAERVSQELSTVKVYIPNIKQKSIITLIFKKKIH